MIKVLSYFKMFDFAFNDYLVQHDMESEIVQVKHNECVNHVSSYIDFMLNNKLPIYNEYIIYGSKSLFIEHTGTYRVMPAYTNYCLDVVAVNRVFDAVYKKLSKDVRFFEACDNLSFNHFVSTLKRYKLFEMEDIPGVGHEIPLWLEDGNEHCPKPEGIDQTIFEQYVEQYLVKRRLK